MSKKILYAGDTSLSTAASYLAGVLTYGGLEFEYRASSQPLRPALSGSEYGLYIISDYPVNNWTQEDYARLAEDVNAGAGLLMIGGWESFHGLAGEYAGTPLARLLPVEIMNEDDRVNSSQPWIIERNLDHPIVGGLPFEEDPSYVGGFNRFVSKQGAVEILSLRRLSISTSSEGEIELRAWETEPLLVVGTSGTGRTAAFASDVAPHWVGGFVDWGDQRVTVRADGATEVEVGNYYAAFFLRLVQWTMGCIG